MSERSRWLEDVGFGVAILLGFLYGMAEVFARIGVCLGQCVAFDASFPWGLLIVMSLLVAPKTLGRVTAGKVWEAFASRFGKPDA